MADQPVVNWRPLLKGRLVIAAGLFAFWALAIETRLVYLQVVSHKDLTARADRQQMRTIPIPAARGEIVDRTGRLLAYSVDADTVYAVPPEVDDPAKAARALCGALDDCGRKEYAAILERLSQARPFVYVKRRVTPLEARRVVALGMSGIGFMKESKRFYPNRELAAHLLGYVGLDNVGLHGIEATRDQDVRGRVGVVIVQADAKRRGFGRVERPPTAGGSLEITIDGQLQHIAQRELEAGVKENRAAGGAVVVMDPNSGEILAMASYPTFNPNSYSESSPEARRNRAVQDLYEPGSTFKMITASAGIEQGVVRPEDLIDVRGGKILLGKGDYVRDTHDYGMLTFRNVIVKSSNVGAIRVGLKLGAERLSLYIRRFGFGRASSPDFPGESPGIVWDPAKLKDSALARVAIGYQVGVTPLQMAAALSVVANGGTLYEPHLVRAVTRSGVRTVVQPKAVRSAITPATAATVAEMMEGVVETGGTATRAKIDQFKVAGKTGTSAKLAGGRYSSSDYNASFVGFVPSQAAKLAIVVVLDSPHAQGHFGGVVSAPIFKRIAEASLRHMGVAPTVNAQPPVLVAHRQSDSSIEPVSMYPSGPTVRHVPPSDEEQATTLPDFRGLSARDAAHALAQFGLTPRLKGAGMGMVVAQDPEPGAPLEPGGVCTLTVQRDPRTSTTEGPQK